MAPSRTNSCTR